MPKVFISYSHDSDEHSERVLALSERLRGDGIETDLDQYVNGSPQQGWPRWMLDQLDAAAFVLVICTEIYYRRFRGHERPGQGKGVDWEGALITQDMYDSRSRTLKFVPVFVSAVVGDWIPEPLRRINYYAVTSAEGYERLYDFLRGRAGVEPRPVGPLRAEPRRTGTALTFSEPAATAPKVEISRIIKYAPADLIGRETETKLLSDAWDQAVRGEPKRPHVVTFVALGGEGKTSLVAKWAAELAHRGWPGCDAAFAWSFYSQGTRVQTAASSDLFLKEALTFFGDAATASSAQGAFDKGRRLAQLVGERRALLILDGVEPLQYAPTSPTPGELKDQGLAALLKGLAGTSRGLCVVTTRYSIPDVRAYRQTTAPETKLLRMSADAGVALLRSLGVKGNQEEFETLVADVKGHALTLNLLGTFLRDAHAGDIRRRDLVKLEAADAEEQGGHAFRVMDAYVKSFEAGGKSDEDDQKGWRALALLRLLGLFDRPATADCLEALRQAPVIRGLTEMLFTGGKSPIDASQLNIALTRLEETKLLAVNRDASGCLLTVDSHPLVREYFARRVQAAQPHAWRAAHRRLYEHLCATTNEGEQPTLESLQPLYQAVTHGCQAGRYRAAFQDVYLERIRRHGDFYLLYQLGAFGTELSVISNFFETPWSRPIRELSRSQRLESMGQAGFVLRALGRLADAIPPLKAAAEDHLKARDWKNAAIRYANISVLQLALGNVRDAVDAADTAVAFADNSEDWFEQTKSRCIRAEALHQSGDLTGAMSLFEEAERLQAQNEPTRVILNAVNGYRYCDLLLGRGQLSEVRRRASDCLRLAEKNGNLLDIGLAHLSLGRAHSKDSAEATHHLDQAVDLLRRSGSIQRLPLGLIARGRPEDLDEVHRIATRSGMKLYLADYYLATGDTAAAARLINETGYHRRDSDLKP